jgi:reductive dehalogenase
MKRRDFFLSTLTTGGIAATSGFYACNQHLNKKNASSQFSRPWWVKKINKPLLKIDDTLYKRFDSKANVFGSFIKYIGRENFLKLRQKNRKKTEKFFKEKKPGFRIEDRALAEAAWVLSRTGGLDRGMRSWNRQFVRTPQEKGIKRYSGSPERAALLVKQAARYYGAATVGITQLDRRHINARERGMNIIFEKVNEPYQDEKEKKLVIPDKCKYAIALSLQMSLDNIQCSPSGIGSAGSSLGYSRAEYLVGALAEFIRALGYTAIPSVNDLGSSVAIAVDAGLGELSRTNRLITPEFGPNVRLAKVLTDLPLKTDKPIRFGILEFCKVCKRCAEQCPAKALSFKDEPDFEVRGPWNNPGHQAWFEESPKCLSYWQESTSGCSRCIAVCPWAKKDKTMIHEIVKASSAKIPILASFFTTMDETFGYGEQKDPEKWWHMNLPEYGIDTTSGGKG